MEIKVKFYKVAGLPSSPAANAFYFIETIGGNITEAYLTDLSGTPRKLGNTEMIQALMTWSNVTGKPATFPPSAHTHSEADITTSGGWAVRTHSAKYNHINHGPIWMPNTNYGDFCYETWIKPFGIQYEFSAGNGGGHFILMGVNADGTVSGNVWDANIPTAFSFQTVDKVRFYEWVNLRLLGSGTDLGVIINGVPAFTTPYSGVRRLNADYECIGYKGGSDHQNFDGLHGGWKLWEGVIPYADPFNIVTRPAIEHFGLANNRKAGVNVVANIICDYSKRNLIDTGATLNGSNHPGFFAETLSTGAAGFSDQFDFTQANNRVEENMPVWVYDPIRFTGVAAQKTMIAGSRIYEDFSGPDIHKGNSATLGLGISRIGNKIWTAPNFGKLNGRAFGSSTAPGVALLSDAQSDGVTVLRRIDTSFPNASNFQVIFNYVDASNYSWLQLDQYGSGFILAYISGVYTNLGSLTFGSTWTEAKVVRNGNSIKSYNGNDLKHDITSSANITGLQKGFATNAPLLKADEFAVVNL